jgi:enterochelin esterase-like enzyme
MKQSSHIHRALLAPLILTFLSFTSLAVHADNQPIVADGSVASQSDVAVPNGKMIKTTIFTNLVKPLKPQENEREVDIYLPAAYVHDVSKTQRFSVVYLLHGSPGNPTDFFKHGHWQVFLEQTAANEGFVPPLLVAVDGNYTQAAFGDSEWTNSADGENRFEDFVADEVVPMIDHEFRTIPTAQARTIAGVSEGGYGAVNIALHDPEEFGNVIALSGYYLNDGSGWARRIMGHNQQFLSYNSPLAFVNSPEAVTKFLLEWRKQHYFIGSGLDEKRYTTESKGLADSLTDHGIPNDLCQLDGKHSWELWNTLFITGVTDIFSPSDAGEKEKAPQQF